MWLFTFATGKACETGLEYLERERECVCVCVCVCVWKRVREWWRIREREMSPFLQIKLERVGDTPRSVYSVLVCALVCVIVTHTHTIPSLSSSNYLSLHSSKRGVLFCWNNIGIHISAHTHTYTHTSQRWSYLTISLLMDLAPLRYVCCLNPFRSLSAQIAPHCRLIPECLPVISAPSSVWQSLFGQWYFSAVCLDSAAAAHTPQTARLCNTLAGRVSQSAIELQKPPIFYWANALCVSFVSLSSFLWNPPDQLFNMFELCHSTSPVFQVFWLFEVTSSVTALTCTAFYVSVLTLLLLCMCFIFRCLPQHTKRGCLLALSVFVWVCVCTGVYASPRVNMFVWVPLNACASWSESVYPMRRPAEMQGAPSSVVRLLLLSCCVCAAAGYPFRTPLDLDVTPRITVLSSGKHRRKHRVGYLYPYWYFVHHFPFGIKKIWIIWASNIEHALTQLLMQHFTCRPTVVLCKILI